MEPLPSSRGQQEGPPLYWRLISIQASGKGLEGEKKIILMDSERAQLPAIVGRRQAADLRYRSEGSVLSSVLGWAVSRGIGQQAWPLSEQPCWAGRAPILGVSARGRRGKDQIGLAPESSRGNNCRWPW